MALTRKLLKGMGLTDEQVETIIEAHTETVDGLKKQAGDYKTDAEKVSGLEKRIRELESGAGEDWKAKFEKEHSDFEAYKADAAEKETAATRDRLFRAQLTALGIEGKRADQIARATDLTAFDVENGAYKDAKAVEKAIRSEWSEFVPSTTTQGAKVDTPPANTGGAMTREQIMQITDRAARREAIAKNMELFNSKGGN